MFGKDWTAHNKWIKPPYFCGLPRLLTGCGQESSDASAKTVRNIDRLIGQAESNDSPLLPMIKSHECTPSEELLAEYTPKPLHFEAIMSHGGSCPRPLVDYHKPFVLVTLTGDFSLSASMNGRPCHLQALICLEWDKWARHQILPTPHVLAKQMASSPHLGLLFKISRVKPIQESVLSESEELDRALDGGAPCHVTDTVLMHSLPLWAQLPAAVPLLLGNYAVAGEVFSSPIPSPSVK